ncbi:MAG: cation diffusion facilitator family transporter [Xanthomonadaceae bacterium]|jgi:cobalt-zinc-cadmium efflux system protein|nr:cation diffusion facilitator family transporter [Xanthomonadaceae bacterium]
MEHSSAHSHSHAHSGHHHSHVPKSIRYERPLWIALGLTGLFLVVEVIGAFWSNSLALLSDAAHMATDTLALVVALTAVRLSRRPPDARRTYGYVRFEAFGALVNGGLLFVVAGYILWEAWARFRQPQEVASGVMLTIAVIGLVINLISMRLLYAASNESLNIKGAYLEVWSDMLGSLAVIVGAVIIRFTGWTWVDPVLAVLIGLWVLPRTWILVREAGHVLMEGVPKGFDLPALQQALLTYPGVTGIHDLHVWSLASNTPAMTAHVVVDDRIDTDAACRGLRELLQQHFGIEHVALQMEYGHCGGESCSTAAHFR